MKKAFVPSNHSQIFLNVEQEIKLIMEQKQKIVSWGCDRN
jgi:hypothetical protein